ncbi:MAG: sigma-70 family RNA polymerase sigma factor [Burkholderiaceae bacterium]
MADPAFSTIVESLYGDHHGWLKAWLHRRLGSAHDAADLAHDTFVRILGSRSPGPIREPRAYLTTVARGLVIDHWRRRDIEAAFIDAVAALPPAIAPSPEHRALALEALVQVDALLREMKTKVREAFLLAQIDGLTYREIGQRLGVGERMVKKYMAEAMLHCLRAEPDLVPAALDRS